MIFQNYFYLCPVDDYPMMNFFRKYVTPFLLVLFCWYYSGISFSGHTHNINGKTVAHSHPGAAKGHTHSTAQFNTIDILTHFLSDGPAELFHAENAVIPADRAETAYTERIFGDAAISTNTLRGPPQGNLS